jgi:hypothetical protein
MHEAAKKDARNSRNVGLKRQVIEKNDFYEKIFANKRFALK